MNQNDFQKAIDFIASHPNVILPLNAYQMLSDSVIDNEKDYKFPGKQEDKKQEKKEEKEEPKATKEQVQEYNDLIQQEITKYLSEHEGAVLSDFGIVTNDKKELQLQMKISKNELENILDDLNDQIENMYVPKDYKTQAANIGAKIGYLQSKINTIQDTINRIKDNAGTSIVKEYSESDNDEGKFRSSMKGNTFPVYKRDSLKSHYPTEINGKTNVEFQEQIQDFIDNHLRKLDKDTELHYIVDTSDPDMEVVYLGIRLSDIPESAKGIETVHTSNGTYAIIGTFGYYNKSNEQARQFGTIKSLLSDEISVRDDNERWYASPMYNKVKHVTPGYLVKDGSRRSLKELL